MQDKTITLHSFTLKGEHISMLCTELHTAYLHNLCQLTCLGKQNFPTITEATQTSKLSLGCQLSKLHWSYLPWRRADTKPSFNRRK